MSESDVSSLYARLSALESKIDTLNVGPRLTFLERAVWVALGASLVTGGATLVGAVSQALGG